jgi:hypothetical protein
VRMRLRNVIPWGPVYSFLEMDTHAVTVSSIHKTFIINYQNVFNPCPFIRPSRRAGNTALYYYSIVNCVIISISNYSTVISLSILVAIGYSALLEFILAFCKIRRKVVQRLYTYFRWIELMPCHLGCFACQAELPRRHILHQTDRKKG